MDKTDFRIVPFDGDDYNMWKKRMLMFLKLKKCVEVVQRKKSATDKEEWEEKDLLAVNYIYSSITNKQLEFVSEESTAFGIIKKFDDMYLKESTALQIICRNRLEKIKLNNFSNTANFFCEFEKLINELKNAGAKVGEKEKLNYMLNTLPDSYSYIGDLIDTLKNEDQTVAYVKNKIEIAEMKNNSEHTERKTNVFVARKGSCFKCGKSGHFAKECRSQPKKLYTHNRENKGCYKGKGSNHRYYRAETNEQKDRGASVWVATVNTANIPETNRLGTIEINWLLDSGCTDHIINNDIFFDKFIELKQPVNIYLGDNRSIKATKIGNVVSYFEAFGTQNEVNIKNVYYSKEMNSNLLSYGKIAEYNKIGSKGKELKIFNDKGRVIAVANKENNIYPLTSRLEGKRSVVNNAEIKYKMTEKEKWHRMLGHLNFKYLEVLCKEKLLEGIPKEIETDFLKCKTCIENKMHNLKFKNNRSRAQDVLEIVHTDVCGAFSTTGLNNEKYFVSFVDDYSKIARVYCIKTKDEVFDCLCQFVNESENMTGKKVKTIRCDNGREYVNGKVYKFAREKGIKINHCPAYVHELNGTAERFNRTIMDMARCLLSEAAVDKKYWPEIICAATYLKNRTLANTIEKKTPYEIFFRIKPNVENLRLYGSKVFVRKPEQQRISKWDKKAELGILLGYSDVGYRVLLNNKIVIARNVDIVEEDIMCIGLGGLERNEEEIDKINNDEGNSSSERIKDDNQEDLEEENIGRNELNNIENDVKEDLLNIPRISARKKKSPIRFPENESSNNIYANFCGIDAPCTYEEAINCYNNENWQKAMDIELECLKKNKTWVLVDKIQDKDVLDVKWVYTKKSDGRLKARLVVRGFQQRNAIDDIYSPVTSNQALKFLFSYCVQNGLTIQQADVETAFLNGQINTEVYIHQPKGYEDGTDRVCKLIKAMYGLSESPRDWYECFDKFVKTLGFKNSEIELCLYVQGEGDDAVYLVNYVDDILVCSKSKRKIQNVLKALSTKFTMKDLGEIKEYLGITVEYVREENKMELSQTKYIELLAEKFEILNSRLYKTPMETKLKLEISDNCEPDIKYRNLIGALLYISSNTRPDVSYSVNYLSRFQKCYNKTHFKYALRILKYLYLTKDLKLNYKKNESTSILDCYVDADWAGDITDRKSTTGYIIRLFGNPIFWKSKKQKCVTKASTYAEYVALSEAVTEIKFIKELMKVFRIRITEPFNIYEDNSGVVNIANYGNFTKNSKHIEIHYHYVHETIKEKIINVIKINTKENIADVLTKALCKETFENFRKLLNIN